MKTKDFKRGDQIVYKDWNRQEPGFVTNTNDKVVFCRFWSSSNLGSLRTMAYSEACDPNTLQKMPEKVPQSIILNWLKYLEPLQV